MTDNQLNLINQIVTQFAAQTPENERIKLSRTICIDHVKEQNPALFQKIKNSIERGGIINHLNTPHLDDCLCCWAELILELIWAREKGLDLDVKTRYSWWIDWKIQNTHFTLENKP
jgi:predicted amidohydrolase